MTDRPIIFSAPMVRALLDGRKTQTRRILKPWPGKQARWLKSETLHRAPSCYLAEVDGHLGAQMQHPLAGKWSDGVYNDPMSPLTWVRMPYAPGDRLYVREAWRVGAWNQCDGGIAVDYLADNHARKEWLYSPSWTDQVHTRLIEQSRTDAEKAGAYRPGGGWEYSWSPGNSPCRPRPSIHMPRWASRLTLTVTDVRVQRLQEISEADARAEGLVSSVIGWKATEKGEPESCARYAFRTLWNSLHGPDAWGANPWVVAISFTVQHGNIDQIGGAA